MSPCPENHKKKRHELKEHFVCVYVFLVTTGTMYTEVKCNENVYQSNVDIMYRKKVRKVIAFTQMEHNTHIVQRIISQHA